MGRIVFPSSSRYSLASFSSNAFHKYASLGAVSVPTDIACLGARMFCLYGGLGRVRYLSKMTPVTAISACSDRFRSAVVCMPANTVSGCGAASN